MKKLAKLSALATSVTLLAGAASSALGGTVTVVTSFPKELTGIYKTAFEKANPGIKLEILNKSTTQGIAYVRELPEGQRPDIFWASAPDAFEVLVGQKLLADVAVPGVERGEWLVWGHARVDAQLFFGSSSDHIGDPLVVALTSAVNAVWS